MPALSINSRKFIQYAKIRHVIYIFLFFNDHYIFINKFKKYVFSESHQDAIAAILPFFHIFGFSTCLLVSIFRGVKLITQPKFMPDKFVELLRDHTITYLMVTPPLGKNIFIRTFSNKMYIFSIVFDI